MEKHTEQALIDATNERQGKCLKFYSTTFTGMPDRLILLPGGRVGFIECKEPHNNPTARQAFVHRILVDLGFKVFVLRTREEIPGILEQIAA